MNLTSAEVKMRNILVDDLREAKEKLEQAVNEFNSALTAELDELNAAVENYNAQLQCVEEFRDTLVGRLDDYINDKSEAWQDGERGQMIVALKDEWEQLGVDPLDAFEVDSVEFDADHADDLEALPTEVS